MLIAHLNKSLPKRYMNYKLRTAGVGSLTFWVGEGWLILKEFSVMDLALKIEAGVDAA